MTSLTRRAQSIVERAGIARPTPSFTLIETLVAVGALAFVSVGIALIFETTGRTVTTGRRVSAFNTMASAVEQQLRADISGMTRDGFLVIRNEDADPSGDGQVDDQNLVNNNDVVPLNENDTNPRVRRTDELMFFAKGRFVSVRPPLVPGYEAKSEAARIYYGHGQRWRPPTTTPNTPYQRPTLDQITTDSNSQLGYNEGPTPPTPSNPNRYAFDWTLLRHVTLLCPEQSSPRPVPNPNNTGIAPNSFPDSDLQVALQPAASNIFRSLAAGIPGTLGGNEVHPMTSAYVAFDSGLVDIVTTDLSQIRSVVMTADSMPSGSIGPSFFDPASNTRAEGRNPGVDGQFEVHGTGNLVLNRMQAWMDDALPTWSDAGTYTSSGALTARHRIRYEMAPPDMAGVLEDTTLNTLQREIALGDQVTLSSANFLPHCTEFIVEWSFGDSYSMSATLPGGGADVHYRPGYEGQIIWHGKLRQVKQKTTVATTNGLMDLAVPYDQTNQLYAQSTTYTLRNGTVPPARLVPSILIHAVDASNIDNLKPLTSFFGYVDPTFDPDADHDGKLQSPSDAATVTIPCPWPKLIRVTLSLADANDPSYERTFQFVFDVPQDAGH